MLTEIIFILFSVPLLFIKDRKTIILTYILLCVFINLSIYFHTNSFVFVVIGLIYAYMGLFAHEQNIKINIFPNILMFMIIASLLLVVNNLEIAWPYSSIVKIDSNYLILSVAPFFLYIFNFSKSKGVAE